MPLRDPNGPKRLLKDTCLVCEGIGLERQRSDRPGRWSPFRPCSACKGHGKLLYVYNDELWMPLP